jgi:V/A-type H+/Na+-transporting ATPase subunit I
MFRPKEMKRVRILVLKSKVEKLIAGLHEAGVLDIRKSAYEGLEDGRPLLSFDELSAELLKLRAVLTLIESAIGKQVEEGELIPGHKAMKEAKELNFGDNLKTLSQEAGVLIEKTKTLEGDAIIAKSLSQFSSVDFSKLNTRTLGFKAGEVSREKVNALSEAVGKLEGTVVSEAPSDPKVKNAMALVLYNRKAQEKIDPLLSDAGFNEISVPAGMTTPGDTLNVIDTDKAATSKRLKEVQASMASSSKTHVKKVLSLIRSLEAEAERAEIVSRFTSSARIYIIEGWAAASDFLKLSNVVGAFGNDAMLEDVGFGHDANPPVVLDNPKQTRWMEFITKSYSMPNYFEIDPTVAYFIALPLIYGMIVGDVLYGILSMLIASWLMKKFSKSFMMFNAARIWFYCGIPSIFFGLIFDEWGGLSHFQWVQVIAQWTGIKLLQGSLYIGFHRLENVLVLVGITCIIGLIQLAAGFILGAVNEWNHNKKHAYAKIAWLGIEFGMLFAVLPFMPTIFPGIGTINGIFTPIGLGLLVLAGIVIAVTEGFVGVIEIPSFMGNVFSYTRIAAVGMVGVVLAELVNQFLMPSPQQGLLALLFLPLFIGLHLLNCFIAMFESLIQGGRLNIVEFRGKFLQGGNEMFNAFALQKNDEY